MFSNRLRRMAFGLAALCVALLAAGACQQQAASSTSNAATPGIAADKNAPAGKIPEIDAGRAYAHAKKMVEMGPRPSGSEALKKCQQYIEGELKGDGLKVTEDKFDGETPHGRIAMMNIIAELPGQKPDVVLITGHYDTAPIAGFVGANDGASSAASVLEIARVLSTTKPEYTLWFVFFDGEEAVVDWEANNGLDNTYGSRHLVAKLAADGKLKQTRAMVLVDMIGDKDLDIREDGNSTEWMTDAIWDAARKAGYGNHFLGNEVDMSDDHTPFRQAGIPVVDIIDFNYGPDNSYWHTTEDTLDKISGESIRIVSNVVIRALPGIYNHLDSAS
jgi:glutaminyl-peptide cyclotransferase